MGLLKIRINKLVVKGCFCGQDAIGGKGNICSQDATGPKSNSYGWDVRGLKTRRIVDGSSCRGHLCSQQKGSNSSPWLARFIDNLLIFNNTKFYHYWVIKTWCNFFFFLDAF